MARKKVKLAWITNDSSRRATFKKRKKGLMKKVSELSTLCEVSACAIVYGPYEQQPEVWPSSTPSFDEARQVVARFNDLPEMEQSKKMMNQDGYMRQRITKLKEQLKKQQKVNREKEITHLMYQTLAGKQNLNGINVADLSDLGWVLEERIKGIKERIEVLNKKKQMVITSTYHDDDHHHHPDHEGQDHRIIKSTTTMTHGDHHKVLTCNIGHHGDQNKMLTNNIGHHNINNHYEDHNQDNNKMMMMMGLDVAMDDMKRQPLFMEVMNPFEHDHVVVTSTQQLQQQQHQQQQQQQYHMGCGGGGGGCGGLEHHEMVMLPMPTFYYGDNSTTSWSTAFFP